MANQTKRKHVFKEILEDDFSLLSPNQTIVKILSSRGNNLHEVMAPDASTYLVSMPTKFRKNVWIMRGNFVVVEPIEEGDKVKAEMVRILSKEQIKDFKQQKIWPELFDDNKSNNPGSDDDELFENTNRLQIDHSESSDSDSDEDGTGDGK